MGALQEIANLLVQTFFQLYLLALMLRLLLQLSRADFYNPISQFLVKVTAPLLNPLRRIIPGVGGIDVASVVLILLTQIVAIVLLLIINDSPIPNPLILIIVSVLRCLRLLLNIYFFAILASAAVSFLAPGSYHPAILLLNQLTDPVMRPFRNVIPPLGGLDFSPMFAILAIKICEILLANIAAFLL